MAAKKIKVVKTADVNKISSLFTFEAGDTTDGFSIPYDGKDFKIYVLVEATTDGTLTVKGGEGFRRADDLVLAVKTGQSFFTLDSAYFMNADGNVKIKPSVATIKIAAVEAR